MKRLATLLTALPLFGAFTFTASKALAEPTVSGTPYYLTLLSPTSDYYSSYSGWYYVGNQYYLWGGTFCPSASYAPPSSTQLQMMSDSVTNKKTVIVYYKIGPGGYPCLTGVTNTYSNAATSTSSSATSTTPPEPPR